MVFERPQRQEQPPQTPRPNPPIRRSASAQPPNGTSGGGSRGGSGSGGGMSDDNRPSPWLAHPLHLNGVPSPDCSASFIEYLRWMRSPDNSYKDPTKVQILQMAEEKANYRDRLSQLNERIKLIAGEGNYFQVKCSWRVRVGGHRGPESILLPAFDALGMPYIPSSTLRGVARTQAIRQFMTEENMTWQQAERHIACYFGSLEAKEGDRVGKVIFLDAYPLTTPSDKSGGLSVDIANNIWSWDDQQLKPKPNPFFSLKESTFMIGIRRTASCDDDAYQKIQQWLFAGLQAGIGSQVNTGYGELTRAGQGKSSNQFFQLEFSLEGQLIHGRQKFTRWNWNDRQQEWQMRGQPDAEVRPVAFKSMLRYWFRAFALGVMLPNEVKTWEATLFGAINPPRQGCLTVRISQGEVVRTEPRSNIQGKNDPCGEQAGILTLNYSCAAADQYSVGELFTNLVWLMFHLGGIGQGARRPCYSRASRDRAPWWRGSTLIPQSEDQFWELPDTVQAFQQRFRQRLQLFYNALAGLTGRSFNLQSLLKVGQTTSDRWMEAVDSNCRIVVCSGTTNNSKPYALSVLHDPALKRNGDYDGNLCGKVFREVKPSPVWIADLGDYQVVTVFGATQDPRKKYLQELRRTSRQNYAQIFPL